MISAPDKIITDRERRGAPSIKKASRGYTAPEWSIKHQDELLREWEAQRCDHIKWIDRATRTAPTKYNFPKEHKPSLGDVLQYLTILAWAGRQLGEPNFDAAFYLDQFGYAPEELWKSTFVVNARPGDVDEAGRANVGGQVVFVSEKSLGFGSFASSNIAQRFSNALEEWTLAELDRLEEAARGSERMRSGTRAYGHACA